MNAGLAYTVKHIQKGQTLLPNLHREQIPGLEETFEKGKLLKFVKE